MRGRTIENCVTLHHGSLKLNMWRIRLVGRGRTIGNRVTGNTVPEFESLILRHEMGHRRVSFFRGGESGSRALFCGRATKRVRKCDEGRCQLASKSPVATHFRKKMYL